MKKNPAMYALIVVIISFSLQMQSFPQNKNVVTRGIWMWGSALSAQSTQSIVSTLKDNYINKVYLLVKGTGGSKTSASLLSEFITDAHMADIEVHFWYIVADDNAYVLAHPDAHAYHSPKPGVNSSPYPMTDSKVNLLYPGYKQYVLDNIKYFLDNFDCDGIHLDVIRYSHLVYSFDPQHLQKADSLGCDTQRLLKLFNDNYSLYSGQGFISLYATGDSDVVKWVTMRKNEIYDYVKSIKDLILEIKPGIELTAAFMPEGAYDSTIADVHYAQNYAQNSKVLDEISPMAYFNSYGQTPSWLKEVTEEAIKRVAPTCRIATGYQTFDNVTATQVKQQIQFALDGGAAGVVNFRWGTISGDQWKVIKEAYKKIYDAQPKTVTHEQMLYMSKRVCDSMTVSTKVPQAIYIDSTDTSFVSASDFYYMMTYYLRYYLNNNNTPPNKIPIVKNIAGPINPGGVQTGNQIMLADILAAAQTDADYIDLKKTIPDFTTADSVDYNPPAMFWVYARTINWYANNDSTMPNYATVRECSAPDTWTYGDTVTSVEVGENQNFLPGNFELQQNFPNPFNPATAIEFQLPNPGKVTLKVYDPLGREVATLVDSEMENGIHKINFNGSALPSGIYFYKLSSEKYSLVRKMMLLK